MTLDELMAKLPPEANDIAVRFGPTVLKMAADDLQAWLNYVFVGNYIEAYALYLKAAGDFALVADWDKALAVMDEANAKNADRMELSKQIAFSVCKAMLPLIIAAVGL